MNNWLTVALFAGTVCFSIVGFLYCFLYAKYRSASLMLWGMAWLSHALRNVTILVNTTYGPIVYLAIMEQMLVACTGSLLLLGSLYYVGKSPRRWFFAAVGGAVLWPVAAVMFAVPNPWFFIPNYFFFGSSQIYNGLVLIRKSRGESIGGRIAGCAMILWGLHHFDYPFLRPMAWFAPWGFLIGAVLGLLAAVAIIMAYMEALQAELSRSEKRFRSLFHGNKALFLLIEPLSGKITDASAGAVDFYGYSLEELKGMNISQINMLSPEEIASMRALAMSGYKQQFIFPHKLKTGDVKTVEVISTPVESGGKELLFSIVQDVTARQKALEDLEESRERLRAVVENAAAAIYLADESGRLVEVNAAAEQQTGYMREELLAMAIPDVDANSSKNDPAFFQEVMQSATGMTFESRHRHKDGTIFPVEVRAAKLELHSVPHVLGIVSDLTSRKDTERKLAEANRTLAAVLDGIPALVNVVDVSTREVLFMNRALKEALGRDGVGGVCHAIFRDKSCVCENCPIERMSANTEGEANASVWEDRNPISGRWQLNHDRILPWFDGKTVRVQISLDIGQRKQAEEALKQSKEEAESANKAKSVFLANMSHEIRTPLNGILGMLQLLKTTDPNDEQKEYLLGAIRSTNRLTRLLSDILDISRIEAGKMQIVESEFDIKMIWDSISELFDMEARGKGLLLEFRWDNILPMLLVGDEARLRQILFNLVGNAIKFTEKGKIRIDASLLPRSSDSSVRVLVTVSDTGIGISEEQLKDIFEPFVQAEGSYTRRFQGAGLGLSIVRRLVKLLDGDISIDSTPGEGTTFYLSLPFKLPATKQKPEELVAHEVSSPEHSPSRILLAEDDSLSSITCKRMLEKSGYSVTAVKDGQEALQRLTKEDFDLILMDVQMPVMDGVEATKAIRGASNLGAKSSIPIVAMTAYAMTGDKESFLAAGMDDYISKPVDKAALVEVIERVICMKEKIQ
ncbi:PAS domain S-box protein [Solidesulfovibrio magneticus]|uniref:histidine kinase n=1 Tax=Solidesulfovibrio magneticus (strain ATCC 700980 / DSM 13731 / RS-1) TaxID=573370 RepID=C4XPT8_SOLM1|nr:PAS domain S-box protein [Solidesulfovibrio magneticus]BAH77638.1 two-component hybrid sensor and regulator [Solidesulfovibrio magneticus RS-1]